MFGNNILKLGRNQQEIRQILFSQSYIKLYVIALYEYHLIGDIPCWHVLVIIVGAQIGAIPCNVEVPHRSRAS